MKNVELAKLPRDGRNRTQLSKPLNNITYNII